MRKRTLAVTAVVVLLLLVYSIWNLDAMLAWQRRATPVPFFALMSALPAIGVPMTPLFILAGATFGPAIALSGSLAALAANLMLCYGIATLMRPRIASLVRRFGYELPAGQRSRKDTVRFTLTAKLAPGVPAFIKNYWLGISGVGFTVYFLLGMLTTGLYAILLIVLGEAAVKHSTGPTIAIAAAVALIAIGVRWWRRRQPRDLQTLD